MKQILHTALCIIGFVISVYGAYRAFKTPVMKKTNKID